MNSGYLDIYIPEHPAAHLKSLDESQILALMEAVECTIEDYELWQAGEELFGQTSNAEEANDIIAQLTFYLEYITAERMNRLSESYSFELDSYKVRR